MREFGLDYRDRSVVVTGCATGMGAATAAMLTRLGAQVHGFDVREPDADLASFAPCDLRDPASIEQATSTLGGAPVHALFNCAGLPQTVNDPIDVMKVNFIGMRAFTEAVVPSMPRGSAIASIASSAAFDHTARLETTLELVRTSGYDDALAWCQAHPDHIAGGYRPSKDAVIAWTMLAGAELIRRGIRINCTSPGPTTTPMMTSFENDTGPKVVDLFTVPIMRRADPVEQAAPLLFLNSDAASYINGHNLMVDGGFAGAVMSGAVDLAALYADAIA